MTALPLLMVEPLLRRALQEDLGTAGDIPTQAVIDPSTTASADVVARCSTRVAGLPEAMHIFTLLDPQVKMTLLHADGSDVAEGQTVARLHGSARALLTGERVALNLLARLCGIATLTREAVQRTEGFATRITCTRKTTPGLRMLEKMAVVAGGGTNHRFGLHDAVLIKDNHIVVAGGITQAVQSARRKVGHLVKIEVEVDTLEQLNELLPLDVDAVLLDNMSVDTLREAVAMAKGGNLVAEASGGLTLERVAEVAATGVDFISMGSLTNGAPVSDIGLDFQPL